MSVHAVGPRPQRRALGRSFVELVRARKSRGLRGFDPERLRPNSMTHLNPKFAELGVRDEIVRALAEDGKEHPFAIQELTLPLALAGDDLIGQSRTGMGKTLAFGVPLLQRITTDAERPLSGIARALVVVLTREPCLQMHV